MLVKVLKAFPYAHDGIHNVTLEVDAVEEVHDDLVPGLAAAGYVGEPDDDETVGATVEIPADWRDAKNWFTTRSLAAKISGGTPASKADAVAIVEAEESRRAAAQVDA